ncbi:MAG: J domain-containing protein [Rhodospirillales bacterium]|nr:J domain-containing protein [Rhodospirillales bacterium]
MTRLANLLLGIALLGGIVLFLKWFSEAETKSLVRSLKWIGIAGLVVLILFLALTGRLGWALGAAMVLLPMALRLYRAQRTVKNFARAAGFGRGGQSTNIETRFLRMSLNHDTGVMDGEVLEGAFAGRRLSDLSLGQILQVLAMCSGTDAESMRVLEAYLDRSHPTWRDEEAVRNEDTYNDNEASNEDSAEMSREQAYDILGLEKGASDADIKAAYQRLIAALHPDRGGSNYLAAKINQARQVLLGR